MDRRFILGALCMWGGQRAVAAPALDQALPSITVTGNRSPESISRQSNNVTVITAEDIARSPATDVITLLATQANLSIQSFFGNDKNTTIDMRGMGATATSNVLVLVDGERLNENDLAGADLSTLSLGQIERIEVIRGGGAVRYGQGAVGGVINITTKRPAGGPVQADFMARAGSYNSNAVQAVVRGGSDRLAGQLMLSHSRSDGYRDNGGLESNTATLELRHLPDADRGLVDLYVRANLHDDRYGLPGAVSQDAFMGQEASRRATQFPLDGGSTTDQRFTVGGGYDWGPSGKMSLRLSQRDRRNPYVIGASPDTLESAQGLVKSEREDLQWRYDLVGDFRGNPQSLTVGIAAQNGRYARWDDGVAVEGGQRIAGQAQTRSLFVDTNNSPVKGLNIHAGVRQDWFTTSEIHQKYARHCHYDAQFNQTCAPDVIVVPHPDKPDVPERHWTNPSAELGLSWSFAPRWTWFGSVNRHVRYPNLDELALQADTLGPQQGYTVEQGLRQGGNSAWSWSATVFAMRIEDEIYYGKDASGDSINRNYEQPTLRKGLELEARWRANSQWSLRGQWAYVLPKFEDMPGNPDIPLVPRNTFSAEVTWDARPDLQWSVQGRHGSQRQDGNALENASAGWPVVQASTVVDSVLRLHRASWQLSLSINNVFDEVYATQAYSSTTYPMPGRAAYLEWRLSH